jgi:hypothetical protein
MSQPNVDFMMNMTRDFLEGKIDIITYALDFPYELKARYSKMEREDDDYCYLIYEVLYLEGVVKYDDLSDEDFTKLIRKQYRYINKIASEGFY